jgi:prepilin-type N-terminal cleavage/methylation domain-containing protein
MKDLRRAGGFTLVELIFALFIGALLVAAIYFTMIWGQKSSAGVERKVAAQQDVRAALEIMAMEIGMASYNPTYQMGPWVKGPSAPADSANDCVKAGNQSYKGIQEATATSVTVEMDIGENGTIGGPDANEVIRYEYDAENEYITRSTDCGTAQPFLGAAASSTAGTRTVRVINRSAGIKNGPTEDMAAVFRYYDRNGTELFPGKTPGDIPNIRRIDIALAVETEEKDPLTNQYRPMIYSTSVLVRNHAVH